MKSTAPWDVRRVKAYLEDTCLRYPTVWHIGTFDPAQKLRGSHEGNGLSVSLDPEAWGRIARLSGELYRLSKPTAAFVDVHASLRKKPLMRCVWDWAAREGYVERGRISRVEYYNDEVEDWIRMAFLDEARAREEFLSYQEMLEGEEVRFSSVLDYVPTERMAREVLHDELPLAFVRDFALLCFVAHASPQFDGLWWCDTYDPVAYSAPRGMIFPHQLESWRRTRGSG